MEYKTIIADATSSCHRCAAPPRLISTACTTPLGPKPSRTQAWILAMGIIKSGYNGLDKGPPVRVRPVGPCVTNIRLSSQVYATALLSRLAYPPGTSCPTRRITFTCYPQSIPDAPRHPYALFYLISGTASSSPQYHDILDITTSPKGIHRQIWAFIVGTRIKKDSKLRRY